jgi:hypothetical protein
MDNIDYPLKLPREFVKGAGFADQKQRRRNRFGCFGRPFCPRRIERDAISIAHNRITSSGARLSYLALAN